MPVILITLSGILTIAGFFGRYGLLFDLASHFRLQYLAIQLLCILLCIPKKRWKLLVIVFVAAIINLTLIIPLYIPRANNSEAHHTSLSILLFNINTYNKNYNKVSNYIDQIDADILALEEINPKWVNSLSNILSRYPYKKFIPRDYNFGIGLYSKIPPNDMAIKYYGSAHVPSVLANYHIDNKPLTLLLTHPVPPVSLDYFRYRNEQLKHIASQRSQFGDNLILAGDLNATNWSYYFQIFCDKMKLIDSRRGFGLQTTWPTWLPFMATTIDHILVSDNITVIEHKIGPYLGSDHKPVYVRLAL